MRVTRGHSPPHLREEPRSARSGAKIGGFAAHVRTGNDAVKPPHRRRRDRHHWRWKLSPAAGQRSLHHRVAPAFDGEGEAVYRRSGASSRASRRAPPGAAVTSGAERRLRDGVDFPAPAATRGWRSSVKSAVSIGAGALGGAGDGALRAHQAPTVVKRDGSRLDWRWMKSPSSHCAARPRRWPGAPRR